MYLPLLPSYLFMSFPLPSLPFPWKWESSNLSLRAAIGSAAIPAHTVGQASRLSILK